MATVNFINRSKGQSRAGLKAVLSYTMRDDKTRYGTRNLVSGIGCSPSSVYEEFINTKLLHQKDKDRMYYHFVQSFPKGEDITPDVAHEIALKLATHYSDFEVLVCTHTEREHIHSHFIINSVSYQTGKKLHQSAHVIPELRMKSDALCMEYGLSICQPKQDRTKTKAMSIGEYHMAAKGKSWKLRLANVIDECMNYASSKDSFIALMESEGYQVHWTDSRKSITYTIPNGTKCRDHRLHEEKYLKERMEDEFRIRRAIINGGTETAQPTATEGSLGYDETSERCGTQPECALGQNRGSGTADVGTVSAATNRDDSADDAGGACQDKPEPHPDAADTLTGWETERAFFFSAENQFATTGMDTAVGYYPDGIGGLISDVVDFGNAVEHVADPTTVIDSTTQVVVKERKKGTRHQEDDEESQEYKMTMY